MAGYLPTQEQKLLVWLNNFCTVANADLSSLGIPQPELVALRAQTAGLAQDVTNVASAKAAYEGNVQTKDVAVVETSKSARALVRKIQNNPSVSDGLKAQLGITVPSGTRTKTAPVTPIDVLATPQASGINTLAWDATGNKATTQYVILAKTLANGARVGDDTGWSIIGQTTRSKFAHTGVTPGMPMAYRVMAARAGQSSQPSLPAVVYGGVGDVPTPPLSGTPPPSERERGQ